MLSSLSVHTSDSADPNSGKGHKTTTVGGDDDLARLALEQQAKLQKEKEDSEAARRAQAEQDAARADGGDGMGDGRDGYGDGGDGGDGADKADGADGDDENNKDGGDGGDGRDKKKRVRTGPLVPDTVIGKIVCLFIRLHNAFNCITMIDFEIAMAILVPLLLLCLCCCKCCQLVNVMFTVQFWVASFFYDQLNDVHYDKREKG